MTTIPAGGVEPMFALGQRCHHSLIWAGSADPPLKPSLMMGCLPESLCVCPHPHSRPLTGCQTGKTGQPRLAHHSAQSTIGAFKLGAVSFISPAPATGAL